MAFLSFLELQKSLQDIFSGVLNTMGKGLKALAFNISEILLMHFLKTCFSFLKSGFLSFLELQVMPTSKFSGVLNTMAKVWKALAFTVSEIPCSISQNTFLLRKWLSFILELQKSLLVSFQGAEHNGIGLKALAFTVSEISHFIFSKFLS